MRFSPGCSCCGGAVICGCSVYPDQWDVSVANVVGACGGFSGSDFPCDMDGTYTLDFDSANNRWEFNASSSPNCYDIARIRLECSGTNMILSFFLFDTIGSADAIYSLASSSFDCLGNNTMVRTGSPSPCTWPNGIDIDPTP